MSVAIRTRLPPTSLVPAVRRIVRDLDPDLPIASVRTMERIVADSMARTSFTMSLLLIAAAVALLLGTVGIYGVISYAVSRRTREIGVRIALGAQAADVSWLVLRQGTGVVLAGLGAGVLAALALTRFLRGLLFEVSPTDATTFAAMSVLLLFVALLASYFPARCATRVDPMVALRAE
jgi:putative ABC transport system permease protein